MSQQIQNPNIPHHMTKNFSQQLANNQNNEEYYNKNKL